MTSLQIMHSCRFARTDVSDEETATKRNGASVAGSGRCTLARAQVTATGGVGTYPLTDGASRYMEHLLEQQTLQSSGLRIMRDVLMKWMVPIHKLVKRDPSEGHRALWEPHERSIGGP